MRTDGIGKILVKCRIFRNVLAVFFILLINCGLLIFICEETAIGDTRFGVIRMTLDKALVCFTNGCETLLNEMVQFGIRSASALSPVLTISLNPSVNLLLGDVIVFEKFLIFFLDGSSGVRSLFCCRICARLLHNLWLCR